MRLVTSQLNWMVESLIFVGMRPESQYANDKNFIQIKQPMHVATARDKYVILFSPKESLRVVVTINVDLC